MTDTPRKRNAKEVRRREARAREYKEVLKSLLSRREGRLFLYTCLEGTGLFRNPFAANALTTSFACGEMNVGQRLLADIIEADPAGYVRMLQELNENDGSSADNGTDDDADDASSARASPD